MLFFTQSDLIKKFRIAPEEVLAKPEARGMTFTNLFSLDSLAVEVYVPIAGTGTFYYDGKRSEFGTDDFLFVPAGVVYRFEHFSEISSSGCSSTGRKEAKTPTDAPYPGHLPHLGHCEMHFFHINCLLIKSSFSLKPQCYGTLAI